MDKESAILQGAFLLANKQCLPASLSSLQKADWSRVKPTTAILAALTDICGEDVTRAACWKKKLVCVVWLKLLCQEVGEDVETTWRESPFFPLHYGLPDVSRTLLLELVKSMSAAGVFARLLLRLPHGQLVSELERLTQHVRSSPTSEDDVLFFLDLWWELWKGSDKAEDGIETVFAKQFSRLTSSPVGTTPQAAKRIKLDTLAPSSNTDVLHILLHALKDFKECVSSTELCLYALTISLDALYTSFLIQEPAEPRSEEKLSFLSKAVAIREKSVENLSAQLLQELLRDFSASGSPSSFRPSKMELADALKIVTELAQFWQSGGLLESCSKPDPSYTAFKLQQSVQRVLAALEDVSEVTEAEKSVLRAVQESLAFPDVESSSQLNASITMSIITHRLDDYQSFAALFAGEESWAACDEQRLSWLEKNQAVFREHGTLIKLATTLSGKLHADGSNVNLCRKLMKVVADIFSALPLEDKNKSLAAMLRLSSKGFFEGTVPSAVTDAFKQELNMAFNCIIQVGGGTAAAAAAAQGSLNTAVSLVARVAFQNPEAALRSCCHAAIFNKGAFALMAKILQQLPGLRGHTAPSEADKSERSLLCTCLQEEIRSRSLSSSEKEQFLNFVGLLMMPAEMAQGDRMQLLPPQELVNACVLQNLSATSHSFIDLELSLQLLHAALSVDIPDDALPSPHWVMECSPFPLLYMLAQLHDQALRCWEQPPEGSTHHWSMDTKELLEIVLTSLARAVGTEVAAAPSSWSRALFWLYDKLEEMDWTVRFHLKPLWGEHFKNEVPASMLTVCVLPEQEWSALDLPQYSQGTGLLAWMECCALSDSLCSVMLSSLSLDQRQPDHVSMFSKGLLVALTQTLPWCTVSQWSRLLGALRELLASGRLHVPFSLEYVDFLPLLDLRRFSSELCLSVMLLRVLQLLCGSSCSDWLTGEAWAHIGRLYAHAVREMMDSLRAKLPLPANAASLPPKAPSSGDSGLSSSPVKASTSPDSLKDAKIEKTVSLRFKCPQIEESSETNLSQEVLFVLSQLFCHVQHIQVMMPGGQCEPLFLSSLEILSHYKAIMAAFPDSSSPLESDNTRHFFSTITDNLQNQEMKAVLKQKIAQLISSTA